MNEFAIVSTKDFSLNILIAEMISLKSVLLSTFWLNFLVEPSR